MKKGQISIFIIIAIVIVLIVGIIFYYLSYKSSKDINNVSPYLSIDQEQIYNEILDCLKEKAYEGLSEIGIYGGDQNSLKKLNSEGILYYLYEGQLINPSISELNEQVSLYIDHNIKYCIYSFNNSGLDIRLNNGTKSHTDIKENHVNFDISYPVTIKKNSRSFFINKFQFSIPIRFGYIYNQSLIFINNYAKNAEGLCLTCLSKMSNENNLEMTGLDYGKGDFVINLRDININEKRIFLYRFAIKFKEK